MRGSGVGWGRVGQGADSIQFHLQATCMQGPDLKKMGGMGQEGQVVVDSLSGLAPRGVYL